MSVTGGNGFTNWRKDDIVFLIFSFLWPVLLILPVGLAFATWSIAVVVFFGIVLAIADFLFSGVIISILNAGTFLVWWTTFLLFCGFFYSGLLSDHPKRNPKENTTYVWWIGVTVAVAVLLGWRLIQDQSPRSSFDLFWVVAVMIFGAYVISSRSIPLINTVARTNSQTVTVGVTGYMIGGVTLEVTSYLFNGPIRNTIFDSTATELGMTFVYIPVLLLGEFVNGLLRFAGQKQTIGSIVTDQGLGSAVEFATFNLNTGAGMYSALAVSLIGLPLIVFIVELIYYGALTAIASPLKKTFQIRTSSSRRKTSGRPVSWYTNLLNRARNVFGDLIISVFNLRFDVFLFGRYVILTVVLTFVATGVITLLNRFAIGRTSSPVVNEAIEMGVGIIALSMVLLTIGTRQANKLNSIDEYLFVDKSAWHYPITLPLVGVAAIGLWGSQVFPPWTGIIPRIVSVGIVWVFVFRVSVYLTLTEQTNWTGRFQTPKRRIHDLFPDGERVGKVVVGSTTALLSLVLVIPAAKVVDPNALQPVLAGATRLIAITPFTTEFEMALVAVTLVISAFAFLSYVFRSLIKSMIGYIPKVKNILRSGINILVTVGKKVKRWTEYAILLRP